MDKDKLARQIAFFGEKGQDILNNTKVMIVGVGGVGSHIAQQLAFLNLSSITIIDDDKLEDTNFNRLIGLRSEDPVGTPKVEIIFRNIKSINPDIHVRCIESKLSTQDAFKAIKSTDLVFSCVDNDGARLIINELCLAYEIPFIDVASDILKEGEYGGHVIPVTDSSQCLYCLGEIDGDEARKYLQHPDARKDEEAIYGVDKVLLKGGGPSVVSINGVVASLAVTEFMLGMTGIRKMNAGVRYIGSSGIVRKSINHDSSNCYYCNNVRGLEEKAYLEKTYL